jgi:GrpB-like predicted nucleotidyltransferase (UPF0157 family)
MPDSTSTPITPYPKQQVEFQEYDARAPEVAQYVIDLIQAQLPSVTVEHIGSTAVPSCAGRGVIDLMILYTHEPLESILSALDTLGFQWVQRINALPDEWPKGAGAVQYQGHLFRLHIHVQPSDHPTVADKRAFRDRLRSEPTLRAAYIAHKQAIIASGTIDPIAYTAAKAGFVHRALDPSVR